MIGDNFMWVPEGGGVKVEGETTDEIFAPKKAFEILTFSFEMTCSVAAEDEPKDVHGKGKFTEFTITKLIDSSSVALAQACAKATPIPTLMLALRKAGGSGLIYLQYCCRDNRITHITWDGGKGDGATESIQFRCKAMGMQYMAQKATGRGKYKFAQNFTWNSVQQIESLIIPNVPNPPGDPTNPYLAANTE